MPDNGERTVAVAARGDLDVGELEAERRHAGARAGEADGARDTRRRERAGDGEVGARLAAGGAELRQQRLHEGEVGELRVDAADERLLAGRAAEPEAGQVHRALHGAAFGQGQLAAHGDAGGVGHQPHLAALELELDLVAAGGAPHRHARVRPQHRFADEHAAGGGAQVRLAADGAGDLRVGREEASEELDRQLGGGGLDVERFSLRAAGAAPVDVGAQPRAARDPAEPLHARLLGAEGDRRRAGELPAAGVGRLGGEPRDGAAPHQGRESARARRAAAAARRVVEAAAGRHVQHLVVAARRERDRVRLAGSLRLERHRVETLRAEAQVAAVHVDVDGAAGREVEGEAAGELGRAVGRPADVGAGEGGVDDRRRGLAAHGAARGEDAARARVQRAEVELLHVEAERELRRDLPVERQPRRAPGALDVRHAHRLAAQLQRAARDELAVAQHARDVLDEHVAGGRPARRVAAGAEGAAQVAVPSGVGARRVEVLRRAVEVPHHLGLPGHAAGGVDHAAEERPFDARQLGVAVAAAADDVPVAAGEARRAARGRSRPG